MAGVEGSNLNAAGVVAARADFRIRLQHALAEAGYPASVDPAQINLPLLGCLLFGLIVFSTMVYAPAPVMALEMFPTRIRYSGLSLPYHIGSGWFGGFLPAIAFAMVAANGSIYFGLWYPVVMASISIVVLAFFIPESKSNVL